MGTGEPLQGTMVYKYHWRPTLKRLGLPLKLVQELLGTCEHGNHCRRFPPPLGGRRPTSWRQVSRSQGQNKYRN